MKLAFIEEENAKESEEMKRNFDKEEIRPIKPFGREMSDYMKESNDLLDQFLGVQRRNKQHNEFNQKRIEELKQTEEKEEKESFDSINQNINHNRYLPQESFSNGNSYSLFDCFCQ